MQNSKKREGQNQKEKRGNEGKTPPASIAARPRSFSPSPAPTVPLAPAPPPLPPDRRIPKKVRIIKGLTCRVLFINIPCVVLILIDMNVYKLFRTRDFTYIV